MSIFLSRDLPDFTPEEIASGRQDATPHVAFFMRSVITPRRLQTVTGFLEELPIFYLQSSNVDTTLHHITRACALAAYGIRHDSQTLLNEARTAYDVGIVRLSQEILSVRSAEIHVALMSAMLCLFYEFIMCLREDRPFSNVHEKGIVSLLRAAGGWEDHVDSAGSRLLEAARHHITNDCLESGLSATEVLGPVACKINATGDSFGPFLTQCIIRVTDLIHGYETTPEQHTTEDLLQKLELTQDIDLELEQWKSNLPSHWTFSEQRNQEWPDSLAYEGRCDTYYDVQVASVWNCYRRARIALLGCMVRIVRALRLLDVDGHEQLEDSCISHIKSIADDICASVPFHLGTRTATNENVEFPSLGDAELDAVHRQTAVVHGWYLIVLPIQRLTKLETLPRKQKLWITRQYDRICAIVARKHKIDSKRVARTFETAIVAFATATPINSRHLRYSIHHQGFRERQPMQKKYMKLTYEIGQRHRQNGSAFNSPRISPIPDNQASYNNTLRTVEPRESSHHIQEQEQPRCWEHSCGGRLFANWSNLERHRKERKGGGRWACSKCGASFTRRTSHRTHILTGRCNSPYGRPRPRIDPDLR